MITNLTSFLLHEYKPGDSRNDGGKYNSYYLDPFVVSIKDSKWSITDGQQRLTSLTLFLIYLHHLQEELGYNEKIGSMIFLELCGNKSFNITVEERTPCLTAFLILANIHYHETDDDPTINVVERYHDIHGRYRTN